MLLDIVVADELRTGLRPVGPEGLRARLASCGAEVWRDPRAVIGGSDAGAHLDMMCGAIYSTALLSHGVREFGVLSLEEAIHRITDVPARLYGLRERGRIAARAGPPTSCCSTPTPSATSPSGCATTSPAAPGASTPTPPASTACMVNGVTVVAGRRAHRRHARHAAPLRPRHRHRPPVKVEIDRERCMGSGNCIYWAAKVFDVGDDMVAVVIGDPDDHRERVELAAEHCPTNAISRPGGLTP